VFEQWEYTIDEDTSEASLEKIECKITIGILTDLVVFFPAGCHKLARCRIYLGEKPVAPRSPKLYLAGDDGPIEIHGLLEPIRPNLPVLNWHVWNIDETYKHSLSLRATWTPLEESELEQMIDQLKNLNLNFQQLKTLMQGKRIM